MSRWNQHNCFQTWLKTIKQTNQTKKPTSTLIQDVVIKSLEEDCEQISKNVL